MSDIDTVTTSNSVRLSGRQWLGLSGFGLAVCLLLPLFWKSAERFEPDADYRIPLKLGNDYWHFGRWAAEAARRHETLLVGDSVVWGHFVQRNGTLSHHLNALTGSTRFANLGLDGSHPAALAGLVEHYGGAIRGKDVILLCNPTWISSAEPDLRDPELRKEQVFPYNHAPLIPQFSPPIPCYRENASRRLGHAMDRHVPFAAWTRHLQVACFGDKSIPEWTLENPYANPLAAVTLRQEAVEECPGDPFPWTERGLKKQDLPWVDLETSVQWASFRRTVEILRKRGNRLLVVVGPYNEHLLKDASLERYLAVKAKITDWLRAQGVPHLAASVLPSETFADASHPLDRGYALLARELLAHEFLKGAGSTGLPALPAR
jgi:hypothetical protein